MAIDLQPGIKLHVSPTKKYKTIRIYWRFTTRLEKDLLSKRALLASLLETNSLNYPDQTKLSSRLAELYGASFGTTVGRKGNLHWLNGVMSVVNGKYIDQPAILAEAVDFLKEIFFHPNIKNGAFDEKTFRLEKENMRTYLESLKEDKQVYASLALQELYYDDPAQKSSSFGSVEDLLQLTAKDVADEYAKMLAEDQIDIFVVGDVTEADLQPLFEALPFTPREWQRPEIFYEQTIDNVIREKQEQADVIQAKLNLGYSTEIYYGEPERFALFVFNGLFGGFPHSKLFMNVREKESLAYYASSSADTFRGSLRVQTGIEAANRNKVLKLVNQQLESLRQGDFNDLEMAQTKAMLKNQYLLSLDNPQTLIETAYLDTWLPESKLTTEEWSARLEAVTKEDVMKVAKDVKLQAIFFLDGGAQHG